MKKQIINPRKIYVQDPLDVIPVVPLNVETKKNENGLLHLRAHIPLKKWQKKIADFLRYDYTKVLQLDEMGTAFYERVDGIRSIRQIAREMALIFKADVSSMEDAAIKFTKMLMERSMLVLKLEKENSIGQV